MSKELFDDAIGEVPPSTVDVDTVIARGRRAVLVRRLGPPVVAAVAVGVLVTGGVALTGQADRDGGPSVGEPPGTSSSQPVSVETTPVHPPTTEATARGGPPACNDGTPLPRPVEVITRFDDLVFGLVRERLSATTALLPNPGARQSNGEQYGPLRFYHVYNHETGPEPGVCGDGYFMALANTAGGDGAGNVMVLVAPAAHNELLCSGPEVTAGQTFCETTLGPNNELIMTSTLVSAGGVTTHRVDMIKPDGTSVVVSAENVGGTGKTGNAPTAASPPLSHGQLTAVALHAGLTLFG